MTAPRRCRRRARPRRCAASARRPCASTWSPRTSTTSTPRWRTFHHPRYEIIATGDVHDGEGEVARYFQETRAAFPDQRNELIALRHSDDAVVVEFDLKGTHLGSLRGLPPTGREFTCRMVALFLFDEDRLVGERVYFDSATILRQLGIAHDPLTLKGRVATAREPPAHDRPRRAVGDGATSHHGALAPMRLRAAWSGLHASAPLLDIRTMGSTASPAVDSYPPLMYLAKRQPLSALAASFVAFR